MTTLMPLVLSLSTLALLLSMLALYVASRTSDRTLARRLNALSELVTDLQTMREADQSRIKSIRAQVNAASLSRKANAEVPELNSETIEEAKDRWTRDTNRAIAANVFKNPLAR